MDTILQGEAVSLLPAGVWRYSQISSISASPNSTTSSSSSPDPSVQHQLDRTTGHLAHSVAISCASNHHRDR
jgi:hypothetical protein